MPGEAHVYFTAFSSGRKSLVMSCVKYFHIQPSGAAVISLRATCLFKNFIGKDVVSLAAVFWGERCVTAQKTAARETSKDGVRSIFYEPDRGPERQEK